MSTLTSPERPHSVTPHLATMDQATTSIDAAASLRALALSTLKKRKTTTATAADTPASLPSRPIPHDNSIHLDYGTEESSFGASTIASSSAGPSTTVKIPSPPQATPMDVDDDQTREEGEISDSESTPTPKPPQTPPKTVPAKPQPTAPSLPMKPRSSPLAKSAQLSHTDASTRPKSDISAPLRGQQTTHLAPSSLPYTPPDHDMSIVEDTQVRPGLVMTQAQYDKSKDIVLDLLGWGVPPEYLVTCGLSREIIYYIFLDLNLRLPTNLDMTGLPQLPTAEPLRYTSPEPISPPIAPSFNRQRSQSASTRQTQVHPSLPLKPTAPQGPTTAEGSSLSATATPFVPSTPPAPDQATSLIDMELQRRQELLARKAVLASRKSKQATLAVPAARSTLESRISDAKDVTMAEPPSVPKQAVDDFLNSIPSASHAPQDDMDVDGPIPGLSSKPPGLAPSPQILEPPSSISATSSSGDLMFQSSAEASLFSTPRQTLATDRESVGRSSSVSDEKSDVSEPLTREPSIGVRRGTKRPVASDFVDMEPGPSRSHHNGYNNHQSAPHGHHYHARKRPQSFAGVATSRRMVIDLSDTSDDDDDEDGTGSSWATRHQHRPRQPHRLAVSNSVPSIGSPSGSATPAALQEKEEAIKKMRELIAQRERARKDKLAARPTPPVVPNSEQVQQVTVTVKQEEDDNTASASLADPTSAPLDPKVESDDLISKPATPVPSRSLTPGDPPRSPDNIRRSTEHTPTTDQVITAEVQQESTARASSLTVQHSSTSPPHGRMYPPQDNAHVDVDGSILDASSTQDVEMLHAEPSTSTLSNSGFSAYCSPLFSYPLLRASSPWRLSESLSGPGNTHVTLLDLPLHERPDSDDPQVLIGVNMRALKAAAVQRWLSDPSKRICQYEVPGGGECRDDECEDIHPSEAWRVEPSDEETARHMYAGLPKSSPVTLEQLQSALQAARTPDIGFHMRIRNALETLGLRTTPSGTYPD